MPNLAAVLKNEIARIARKEIRAEVSSLKRSVSSHRADLAGLKRHIKALEQQVRQLKRPGAKADRLSVQESSGKSLRFSAKGLASQRRRLGLSAEDCGLLLGASGQTIYNWEHAKARPRARHLPAIAALRSLGKKQAAVQLDSLRRAA
jgi:DNA-binding transcriptional regulator YiaG